MESWFGLVILMFISVFDVVTSAVGASGFVYTPVAGTKLLHVSKSLPVPGQLNLLEKESRLIKMLDHLNGYRQKYHREDL